jgi:DNA-binding transcriptional regulator YhcF (GntR family)
MTDPTSALTGPPAGRRPLLDLEGSVLQLILSGIDREIPVSLNMQLRGVIEYGILMGRLPPGTRLPAVRELAEGAGVATMTVVSVYGKLKEAGLIETRPKAGTFVAGSDASLSQDATGRLSLAIDALLDLGRSLNIGAARIAEMVGVRENLRRATTPVPLRLLFVGLFEPATSDYAKFISDRLPTGDSVDALTLDQIRSNGPPANYDLVLTLANRRTEVQALFRDGPPVTGVNFVPSAETRSRLAGLDPASRVGMISTLPEFTALMRPNVLRFIPHVASAEIIALDSPDLETFIRGVDVVVYATGSDRVRAMASARQIVVEYRHAPDPNNIRHAIVPLVEEIRASRPNGSGRSP